MGYTKSIRRIVAFVRFLALLVRCYCGDDAGMPYGLDFYSISILGGVWVEQVSGV